MGSTQMNGFSVTQGGESSWAGAPFSESKTKGFNNSVTVFNQRQTQNKFFTQTNQGFGVTNLEGLDEEQLIERLLVAETIMKKIYMRNKELEEFHSKQEVAKSEVHNSFQEPFDAKTPSRMSLDAVDHFESTLNKMDANMEQFVVDFKMREQKLEEEIRLKDEQIRLMQ